MTPADRARIALGVLAVWALCGSWLALLLARLRRHTGRGGRR